MYYTLSLDKGSSKLLYCPLLEALPYVSSGFFLHCFPFLPTLITYSAFSAFSCHILSPFHKQTHGNLIFLGHLHRHTAIALDQSRWATNVGAAAVLWLQVKQYMRRAAEHTHKGDSKSGQHHGQANILLNYSFYKCYSCTHKDTTPSLCYELNRY